MTEEAKQNLCLDEAALREIDQQAAQAYPRECCGCLLGERVATGWQVTRIFRTANLAEAEAHDRYQMDPKDRFRAETWARANGLEVIGFYHSHPDHDVYFSRTDLENSEEYLMGEPWLEPTFAYLVISVREGKVVGRGAFRIKEGKCEAVGLQGF